MGFVLCQAQGGGTTHCLRPGTAPGCLTPSGSLVSPKVLVQSVSWYLYLGCHETDSLESSSSGSRGERRFERALTGCHVLRSPTMFLEMDIETSRTSENVASSLNEFAASSHLTQTASLQQPGYQHMVQMLGSIFKSQDLTFTGNPQLSETPIEARSRFGSRQCRRRWRRRHLPDAQSKRCAK